MRKFMLLMAFAAITTTGLMADKCGDVSVGPMQPQQGDKDKPDVPQDGEAK